MASKDTDNINFDALEYHKVSGSEVHSIWSQSTFVSQSPTSQDLFGSQNALLNDSIAAERGNFQVPSLRNTAIVYARALEKTKVTTWFGESDGSRKYRGWRKAVVAAAVLAAIVLVCNVTLAIVAAARYGTHAGVGVLYAGDCGLVDRWNTALHLLINILGTCLLGASSFTMQCLSSPTRSETDLAHSLRKPLEIGVPSITNLLHMRRWKAFLWWALCLSTLPLHLFWNSTVFSTIGANQFNYMVVDESFLSGADYLAPSNKTGEGMNIIDPAVFLNGYREGRYKRMEPAQCADAYMATYVTAYRNFMAVTTPYKGVRMSPGALFPTSETNLSTWYGDSWLGNDPIYANAYVGSQIGYPPPLWNGSSVLAYQIYTGTASYSEYGIVSLPTDWPCIGWPLNFEGESDLVCDINSVHKYMQQNGTWWLRPYNLFGWVNTLALPTYPVDYCLVEYQDVGQCQLQYVSYILVIVILCNIVKLACMTAAARYLWDKDEPIFATVGDAVSSYMESPDETTVNWCLMDFSTTKIWQNRTPLNDRGAENAENVDVYQRKPFIRLIKATTKTRWWTTILLCTGYLMTGVGLFAVALFSLGGPNTSTPLSEVWSTYGLGVVNNVNLMNMNQESSSQALLSSILFANFFQLVLSMTYFLFNSLWTAQCSAIEWASYVTKRKPLRVTWPKGQQKSTYYLNLPYQYGIPLIIMLAVLHFLISQSIFLARVQYYSPDGSKSQYFISTAAYSPLGLLIVVCVASAVILALVAHSFRKIDNRIPVHGNSSAVISALCHTLKGRYRNDQGTELEHPTQVMSECNVQWGVVKPTDDFFTFKNELTMSMGQDDAAGHCAFTADEVDLPELGQRYR